jgi:hypothetical protein
MSNPMPEKNETPTLAQMAEALRTERDTLAAQIAIVTGERDKAAADLAAAIKAHTDALADVNATLATEQAAHKATGATRDSALVELADAKAKLAGPQFDAAKSAAATSTPPPASAGAQAADSAKPKTQAELEKAYADLPNDPVLRAKWRKEHLKV